MKNKESSDYYRLEETKGVMMTMQFGILDHKKDISGKTGKIWVWVHAIVNSIVLMLISWFQ